MRGLFAFVPRVDPDLESEPKPLLDDLTQQVAEEYSRRESLIADEIRTQYRETVGGDESKVDFERIARKYIHDLELMAILNSVDERWIEHLYTMDYLRESVGLRAYGQKDPLLEFKTEGFQLFQTLMATIEENVISILFRVTDPEVRKERHMGMRHGQAAGREDPFSQIANYHQIAADKEQDRSFASFDTSRFALGGQQDAAQQAGPDGETVAERPKRQPVRHVTPAVGPNDPCPCGSGKKYKKCCGRVSS
jgi:preprotein translocase subunit SecA